MDDIKQLVGVILNGGLSTRMGQDKSQLKFNNHTLLQHTQSILNASGIKEVFISGQAGIKDHYINKGPLAGIHASLKHLKNYEFVIFMPIDMPLITPDIIKELKQYISHEASYFSHYNLPLIMQNNQGTRTLIEQHIKNNQLAIKQFLQSLSTKSVINTHPTTCFTNTNSPEQWQKLLKTHNNNV